MQAPSASHLLGTERAQGGHVLWKRLALSRQRLLQLRSGQAQGGVGGGEGGSAGFQNCTLPLPSHPRVRMQAPNASHLHSSKRAQVAHPIGQLDAVLVQLVLQLEVGPEAGQK